MMERAAAAQNAGIEGFHFSMESVHQQASGSDDSWDAPIVDIWTFGTSGTGDGTSGTHGTHTRDDAHLFQRLLAALPRLKLGKKQA